jgi:iron complex outermembrane receptor protein
MDIFTRDSANATLFSQTGATPTNFYDGNYTQTQWTSNVDITKEFDLGLATPMNLAFGAEYRQEEWTASPGDEFSRYFEGGQSFPGISTSDSGSHDRDVSAVYVDVVISPLEALRLDLAGRYEDYSDFGDTTVGKLSARYELTDSFALRGTASTGFRAPTLAEAYYSATNVGPRTAFVQMPPNAPASALLGLGSGLQPEKSTNYSMGFVFRPDKAMSLTFDLYQVEVRNRIAATSTFYGTISGELFSQAIVDAIIANGNVLDPEVTASGDTGINLFTNGVTTRTRGVDVAFNYGMEMVGANVDFSIAGTYTDTKVLSIRDTPVELGDQALFDKVALADLTKTAPKFLVNLGAKFDWERFSFSVHELVYGKTSQYDNDGGVVEAYYDNHPDEPIPAGTPAKDPVTGLRYMLTEVPVTPITNLEVSFKAMDTLSFTVGATNVFDKYPNKRNSTLRHAQFGETDNSVVTGYPSFTPFGINGAYYYGKMVFAF